MSLLGNLLDGSKRISDTLNYVDDYKTELVEDEKGRMRKKTTYVGIWYFVDDEPRAARVKLIVSAALCVLAAALCVLPLFIKGVERGWLLAALPKLLALFPLLYLLMGAASLPFSLKPMHRDRYMHSFVRILRSGAAVGVMTLVSFGAKLVYRMVNADWMFMGKDVLELVCGLGAIAALTAAILLLRSVGVEEKPNSAYDEGEIK